jgi:FkbM family methyltransferase
MDTRDGTNDASVVYAIALDDEYGTKDRHLAGWALDVGAHIGAASIALALDNPGLRVVAIEPVPENVELIRRNAATNGVADRVLVAPVGAGADGSPTLRLSYGYSEFDPNDPDYVRAHRFVGNQYRSLARPSFDRAVPARGLRDVLNAYGIDRVAFLKIDCEGCEYAFLSSDAIDRVDVISGEYHTGYSEEPETYTPGAQNRIRTMLERTHDVSIVKDDPIVGLFVATRRG